MNCKNDNPSTMLLSPETLKTAWEEFSVYKKPLARADLIQHYSYLVKVTAGIATTVTDGDQANGSK